jgi:hypothetical protein
MTGTVLLPSLEDAVENCGIEHEDRDMGDEKNEEKCDFSITLYGHDFDFQKGPNKVISAEQYEELYNALHADYLYVAYYYMPEDENNVECANEFASHHLRSFTTIP